jgi:transposase InsO family protein
MSRPFLCGLLVWIGVCPQLERVAPVPTVGKPHITAVWTYEGWLYLAAVLDLFSHRVVGWAMAASQDETLVKMAIHMAPLQQKWVDLISKGGQDMRHRRR